jgi:hypothetical protein
MIYVVANSTNMTTLPERRLWNRVLVHVITRKKDDLRRHLFVGIIIVWPLNTRIFVTYGMSKYALVILFQNVDIHIVEMPSLDNVILL